ncbi:isopeptide-forming domain-containing fimbrial protein [Ligilactobacillus agilis]|uniref:isopeptide-forming domain-containing fimbrial protein n=1 Tax=Ligilactobacillus agilis TaxID=1601 RepID=UPI0025A3D478|nr:isopeptide-forming domain-containing fimbrial protein [Ligilactobacillus agilis]MDM8279152.1 isopeptide-forming domain-containing fimbrial protein [Ligilactobacillus agilis]
MRKKYIYLALCLFSFLSVFMIQDRVFAWDIRNYTGSAGNMSWYHGYEQRNSGTDTYPIIVNWSNGNRDDTHNWLFCIQPYKDFANGPYSDYREDGSSLNNPGNWNAIKWVLNDWDGMHNNGNRTVGGNNRRAYWIYQLVVHALAAGGKYYGYIFNNGMEGGVKRDAQTLYNNALAHAEDHGEREINAWNEDGNGGISLESGNWDVSSRSGLTTRNGEKYYTKWFNVNRWGNADNPSVELKGAPSGTKIEGSTILIPVSAGGNARSYQFQIVAHSRRQNYRHHVVKQAWVWTYKWNNTWQKLADVNSYSERQYTDVGSTTDLVDVKTVTVYPAQNQVVPTKSVTDDFGRNVDVGQKSNDKLGVNMGHWLTYKLSTKVLSVPYEAQFDHGFAITDNVPAEVTLNSKSVRLYQDGREVNKDDYGILTITGNTVKFDFKNGVLNDNNFYGHTYDLDFRVTLYTRRDFKSAGVFQISNSYTTDVMGLTRISNITKVNVTCVQKRIFTTQVKSVDYDRVKNQKVTSTGSLSHNAVTEPWRKNVYEGSWSTDDFGGNPAYDSVGRGDLVGALQFTTGYGESYASIDAVNLSIPYGFYLLDYGFLDTKDLSSPFDNNMARDIATDLYVPQRKLKKETDDGLVASSVNGYWDRFRDSYKLSVGSYVRVSSNDDRKVRSNKRYTLVFILRAIPNSIQYSSDTIDYLYKTKNEDKRSMIGLDWFDRGFWMSTSPDYPAVGSGGRGGTNIHDLTAYAFGSETGDLETFHFILPPLIKVTPVSIITMPKNSDSLWYRDTGLARVRVIYKLRVLYNHSGSSVNYFNAKDIFSQISNLYVTLNDGNKQKVDLSSLSSLPYSTTDHSRDLYFSNDYDMVMKNSSVWSLKLFNSDYDVHKEQYDSTGNYMSRAYDFGEGMPDVPYYGLENSTKPLVLSGGSNEEAYRSNLEIPTEYKMFSSTYNPKTNSDPYFNKTNNGLSNKTVKYVVNNYSLNSGDSIQTEGMTSKGSSFTNADKAEYVNGNVKYYQAYPNTTKTYYNESTVTGSNDISQKAGYFIKTPSIAAKLSEWRPTTSDANALVDKYKLDISSMNLKVTDSSTIFSAGSYDRVNNKETKDISLVPTLQSSSVTGGTVDSRGIIKATGLTALANTLKAGQASQLTYNTDIKNDKMAELQKVISGPLSRGYYGDQMKYYSDNSKVSYFNPAAVQTNVSYAWPNVYISESNNNTGGIVSRSNSTGAIEQRDRAFLRNDLLTNHAYHLIYSSSGLGIDKVGSGSVTKNVNITGYRFLTGDANKQNKESNSDLAVQGYKGGQRLKGFSSSENDWLNR